ncbi:MAG: inorganic phosphate transporter [Salinarimonas sp.]
MAKSTLDKDLGKVVKLETATYSLARSVATPGLLLVFFIGAITLASLFVVEGPLSWFVIGGAVIAAYMALNIGANDVANNMGPAVGSRALTLGGALVIAAFCEAAGAILAGGDVVNTVSRNLLRPDDAMPALQFILLMMSAFLAAAMWINLATYFSAPVSTTHSVVGGVVGAGIAAAGFWVVHWPMIGAIVASWVISPGLGGLIAAALLGFVKWSILFREDRVTAARRWVPVMVGLMTGVFAMYLANKGFSRIWNPSALTVMGLGVLFFLIGWGMARPWIAERSRHIENRRKHIANLFTVPLIFAAALLSFAHGANDVANAVGPLAAIVAAAETGSSEVGRVALPLWVLMIGAVGLAVGLALFGPRLIKMVGEKITRMDAIRAYCVALAAAITVLIASALGLPVSSTHIAVGAIFGVGFLREALMNKGVPNPAVQPSSLFLRVDKLHKTPEEAIAKAQKRERRRLVRRQHALGIATAWIVTVPAAATLAALLYLLMSAFADF